MQDVRDFYLLCRFYYLHEIPMRNSTNFLQIYQKRSSLLTVMNPQFTYMFLEAERIIQLLFFRNWACTGSTFPYKQFKGGKFV